MTKSERKRKRQREGDESGEQAGEKEGEAEPNKKRKKNDESSEYYMELHPRTTREGQIKESGLGMWREGNVLFSDE